MALVRVMGLRSHRPTRRAIAWVALPIAALLVVIAVAVAAFGGVWNRGADHTPVRVLAPPGGPAAGPLVSSARASAEVLPSPAQLKAQRFRQWLQESSSLRGAVLDGSWCVDGQGRLQPCLPLRLRFDQLLTLLGEVNLADIAAHIESEVTLAHGPAAAQAVAERFRAYVALQDRTYPNELVAADPAMLAAALAQRHDARQAALGKAWADAFFADEEAALRALIDQSGPAGPGERGPGDDGATALAAAPAGSPAAQGAITVVGAQGLDPARLDPAARDALQDERQRWQAWEARLQQARQAVAGLQAAPELSDRQRAEAVQRWIDEHFSGPEARRVRALLGLAP